MDVKMFNVGFGDCFLLRGKRENLLVDFGSDTPYHCLATVADNIVDNCAQKPLSVLLSHLHIDHLNGFWETDFTGRKAIDTVYLPDLFAMHQRTGRLTFLQLTVLADILESVVLQKHPVRVSLYTLLSRLSYARTKVAMLSRGNCFLCDDVEYQVLWPSFPDMRVYPRAENAVIQLLRKMSLVEDDKLDQNNLELGPVHLGIIDDFIQSLLVGYAALTEGVDHDRSEEFTRMEQLFGKMNAYIWDKAGNLKKEVIDLMKNRVGTMRHQENRLSIVFQEKPEGNEARLLMTGDVTAPELRRIVLNQRITHCGFKVCQKYRLIKAPHHGTNSYFSNVLPQCDQIMISNGPPHQRHLSWGKISYQYGAFYGSHKKCKLVCTNPRCELLELRNVAKCTDCVREFRQLRDVKL